MYLRLCTEIIYCEKKLGAGFSWSWWLQRAVSGAGGSCWHPGQPKGPFMAGGHRVPGACLGCCGTPPPASLHTGLLCKKPSAPREDSPRRYRAARSLFQRRTLPGEGSGRQERALTVPGGYPCTSRLTRQEPRPAPLLWLPAAGSLPGLFYCFSLNFLWQQAGWVSGHHTV